jgi:hypothetical protein
LHGRLLPLKTVETRSSVARWRTTGAHPAVYREFISVKVSHAARAPHRVYKVLARTGPREHEVGTGNIQSATRLPTTCSPTLVV